MIPPAAGARPAERQQERRLHQACTAQPEPCCGRPRRRCRRPRLARPGRRCESAAERCRRLGGWKGFIPPIFRRWASPGERESLGVDMFLPNR